MLTTGNFAPGQIKSFNETIQLKVFGHTIVSDRHGLPNYPSGICPHRGPQLCCTQKHFPNSDNARKTGNQTGIFVFLCHIWLGLHQTSFQNTRWTPTFAFFGADNLLTAKNYHMAWEKLDPSSQSTTSHLKTTCHYVQKQHATCSANDQVPSSAWPECISITCVMHFSSGWSGDVRHMLSPWEVLYSPQ